MSAKHRENSLFELMNSINSVIIACAWQRAGVKNPSKQAVYFPKRMFCKDIHAFSSYNPQRERFFHLLRLNLESTRILVNIPQTIPTTAVKLQ